MGVKVREKHPGSGVWWIYIDHQGKRKSKKVGKDKKLAIEAANKIAAKLTLGDVGFADNDSVNVPTFKEYVRGWTDSEGRHIGCPGGGISEVATQGPACTSVPDERLRGTRRRSQIDMIFILSLPGRPGDQDSRGR